MFGQTFHLSDIGIMAVLVLLEGLLSADNALVLAIMVKHLPVKESKRALFYGLAGALVLRIIAIMLVTFLIGFWWLQAIGALYLLYLPTKHFIKSRGGDGKSMENSGFWATVGGIMLADAAFAIDSVLAAVGTLPPDKLTEKTWIVIFAALSGIVLLRYAAVILVHVLEKYPDIEHLAYLLIGWVGVKLAFLAGATFVEWYNLRSEPDLGFEIHHLNLWVFWAVMLGMIVAGVAYAVWHRHKPTQQEHEVEELIEEFYGDADESD